MQIQVKLSSFPLQIPISCSFWVIPVGLSLCWGEGLLLLSREEDGGLLKLPGDDPFAGAKFSSGGFTLINILPHSYLLTLGGVHI